MFHFFHSVYVPPSSISTPPPFLLPASCHVLYGERIGLFSSSPSLESQKFIWAVEQMLATTPPLLYLPHRLLLRIGAPLWTQHATAWDHIFSHGRRSYIDWMHDAVIMEHVVLCISHFCKSIYSSFITHSILSCFFQLTPGSKRGTSAFHPLRVKDLRPGQLETTTPGSWANSWRKGSCLWISSKPTSRS